MTQQITDNDYILTDGAAWLEANGFAIRINTMADGIAVDIYQSGKEYNSPLASAFALNDELESE